MLVILSDLLDAMREVDDDEEGRILDGKEPRSQHRLNELVDRLAKRKTKERTKVKTNE